MKKETDNKKVEPVTMRERFAMLSIRRKLLLVIMFISSMVIVLVSCTFVTYELYTFRRHMVRNLSAVAKMVGNNCTGALSFNDPADAEEVLHSLEAEGPIYFASIYYPDGTLFVSWRRDETVEADTEHGRTGDGFDFCEGRLVVWRQIILNDRLLGSVYIHSDLSEMYIFVIQSFVTGSIMLVLACVISYVLAAKLEGTISSPILSLAETASSISESQDYSVRATKQSQDEIGQLTDAFNHMLEEVQRGIIALRQSEEELRRITDNLLKSFVYRHDVEGNFDYVSSSVTKILGYLPDEFLGHFTTYLTDHAVSDEVREFTELSIQGIQQPPYELQAYHKDGSVCWLEVAESPVRDESGVVVAVEGIAHDISDRKRAEESLRESEAKFRGLVESSSDWIWEVDAEGRYTYASPKVEETLGYKPEEVIGKTPFDMMSPDESQRVSDIFKELTGAGKPIIGLENTTIHKDGQDVVLETTGVPVLDAAGKVTGYRGVDRDITERKRAEAEIIAKGEQLRSFNQQLLSSEQQLRASNMQLMANEKEREKLLKTLTVKNEELQSVVYIASHDLKSPLVNISGFSTMLDQSCRQIVGILKGLDVGDEVMQQLLAFTDEEIPESLNFISTSTAKMKMLLDGLLQVSRIGSQKIEVKTLNMNRMIKSITDTFAFQVNEQGVSLEVGDLPVCQGDEKQINQVFSNIVGNALKYLDAERKGIITISGEVREEESVYCIEDNGIGIHANHQGKIFELFHRLNPGDSTEGQGLGLTITKRALSRNNGLIWVESVAGKGSKFFVSLPADRGETV